MRDQAQEIERTRQVNVVVQNTHFDVALSGALLTRRVVVSNEKCNVCHGALGDGRGTVIDAQLKFPFAPALNAAATAGRSDGYIYAVIDVGRGMMPPYGSRMLDRVLDGVGAVATATGRTLGWGVVSFLVALRIFRWK